MKILHAASECFPLAKTGGLGDVVGALPIAQRLQGADARVVLPAYPGVRAKLLGLERCARLEVHGLRFQLLAGRIAGASQDLPVFLLDCAELYDREGTPYEDAEGRAFTDNAWRFGCFGAAVARLAAGIIPDFKPEIVHLHDWQSALAAPLLGTRAQRPRIVFTVHNLAYQGNFGRREFELLGLRAAWWHPDALEFWGGFSFMKAGLNFSDLITTVSPNYAREIQTPAFGCGLDGVLGSHAARLHGIVNGIDQIVWNPALDAHLAAPYSADQGADKVEHAKHLNKLAVLAELGLAGGDMPLVVFIGRLAAQKGADLILAARAQLLALPAQYAILAAGDPLLQDAFREFARSAPAARVAVHIAHDEGLAHRLTAAADLLLMPSRFEPCGLNQMYAQRYGAIPVVHATGGLVDTVIDANTATLADGSASGVHFADADVGGVVYGVNRGLTLLAEPASRQGMRASGMHRDFSWDSSARRYLELYRSMRVSRRKPGTLKRHMQ